MPKIFLWCEPAQFWGHSDVIGYALAEDGKGLASHLSSDVSFSKHDMGLTSNWKHDAYKEHYPDGYEVEWVDDPENHNGWKNAFTLNQQSAQHAPDALPSGSDVSNTEPRPDIPDASPRH